MFLKHRRKKQPTSSFWACLPCVSTWENLPFVPLVLSRIAAIKKQHQIDVCWNFFPFLYVSCSNTITKLLPLLSINIHVFKRNEEQMSQMEMTWRWYDLGLWRRKWTRASYFFVFPCQIVVEDKGNQLKDLLKIMVQWYVLSIII